MGAVKRACGRIVAGGMLREGTPIHNYSERYGLWVKREDLSCLPPGPPFSKTRGVYARVASRPEKVIGVLDTFHSQAGHAVARACQILGKECVNFYPRYKGDTGLREPQVHSKALGAELAPLPAGRSCILYHAARKQTEARGGYMMPNALKLEESVRETARECPVEGEWDTVVIPASSGTIAAGVIAGLGSRVERYIIHLGYSRSHSELLDYLRTQSGYAGAPIVVVDEGYAYKDRAKPGESPPWSCNEYYDLKAFRWWLRSGLQQYGRGRNLFWNVG